MSDISQPKTRRKLYSEQTPEERRAEALLLAPGRREADLMWGGFSALDITAIMLKEHGCLPSSDVLPRAIADAKLKLKELGRLPDGSCDIEFAIDADGEVACRAVSKTEN